MQEENRNTLRKPAEASLVWKPNGHTAPGLAIKLRLSGPLRSSTTLPASPNDV